MIAVEYCKNAVSAAIESFLPFVVFCLATIGVCVFQCADFGCALFYFMEVEKMAYALVVLVYLVVNFLFAALMNSIAIKKGYENSHAFALVFFFGVLGMLYVIALPNMKVQSQLEDILTLLLEKNGEK